MATEKQEYQNLSLFEKIMTWFVPVAAIFAAVVATIFLWFIPQQCDIDNVGAWCRVHPTSAVDVIGYIMFLIGDIWLSSIGPRLAIYFGMDDDQDTMRPLSLIAFFVFTLGGFCLLWFL
jgi:hypothetical protein